MTLSSIDNRISYTGDDATTVFSFPNLFFADDDLKVILVVDSTGVETVQTITTHYTVAGAGVVAGGTVTMITEPATGETLVIIREEQFTQGLDLVENDPFPSDLVERQFDSLTMQTQQLNTEVIRSVKLSDGDTSGVDPTLPTPSALKTFRWNAGLTALEETDDPAVSAAAAAASEAAAATSETNAATSETNAATSFDTFDDRYLGAKASDPTLDNDGDALIDGAMYFNTTDNVTLIFDLGTTTWLRTTPTASDQTAIDTVNANATNINLVAAIDGDVTTVAAIDSDVVTVAADGTDIGVVAGDTTPINTVAGDTAAINTVASISNDVTAVATQSFKYLFDASTTMGDPGAGDIRYDDADPTAVTAIAVSNTPSGGSDISAEIITWDDSTNSALRGTLLIKDSATATTFQTFSITGAITDNGAWLEIPVAHVSGPTLPASTDALFIAFSRTGNKGTDGQGIGDMLRADNLANVASAPTSLSNIGGIGAATTDTLTNKTFDANGTGNSLSNIDLTADVINDLPVTEGGTGASDAATALSNIGGIGAATADTLTNKTFDANGTGNDLSNIDIANCIAASQAEAEAGTDDTKLLTSLRVKQAIDALAGGGFTLGTEQATTSGSSVTFGSIPSGTTRITINFAGVSTTGDSTLILHLGDAGGIETSNYVMAVCSQAGVCANFTGGFNLAHTPPQLTGASKWVGTITLTLEDSAAFTWVESGVLTDSRSSSGSDARSNESGGHKSLSAELTQIKLTASGTFDAGAINISYI